MNDNIAKLLEQLAQKLGTTTEYLWKVLLKQAHIDATVTLIQFIIVILFGYSIWRVHKKLLIKDEFEETGYCKYEDSAAIPMIVATIVFAILFITCSCYLGDIVNGYFNPEYWALEKILNSIK